MNQRDLVPASSLAKQYGVKAICYGPPGSGKTPAIQSAPRPVLLVTEPGLMTMKNSNLPCYYATTGKQISEFFTWASESAEMKQFDTVGIDSGSELAEIVLKEKFATNKDGRKAYGEMSRMCEDWFVDLYHMQQKHVYIICKQMVEETIETSFIGGLPQIQTRLKAKYYLPGKDLPMKVSHKYDLIMQANKGTIPGVEGRHQYFRCIESDAITARDRSGKLAEYEQMDLGALFRKIMS